MAGNDFFAYGQPDSTIGEFGFAVELLKGAENPAQLLFIKPNAKDPLELAGRVHYPLHPLKRIKHIWQFPAQRSVI